MIEREPILHLDRAAVARVADDLAAQGADPRTVQLLRDLAAREALPAGWSWALCCTRCHTLSIDVAPRWTAQYRRALPLCEGCATILSQTAGW
jgi:hypothetical protein